MRFIIYYKQYVMISFHANPVTVLRGAASATLPVPAATPPAVGDPLAMAVTTITAVPVTEAA
jgi:hypothetical protein